MPKHLLLLVAAVFLLASAAPAQEEPAQPPAEAKPEEKKPDAFQYFFGKDGTAGNASEPKEDSSEPPPS